MACPFRYDDDDASMENEDGAENSNPNISTVDDTIRKRDRGLRGRTFRFSGTCTGFTFSNSSLHDRIHEFNRDFGRRFLACKGNHDPAVAHPNSEDPTAAVALKTEEVDEAAAAAA